ncbi:hypothetical protein BH24PSE2_BH24PSE2_19380 [soil metagenome]
MLGVIAAISLFPVGASGVDGPQWRWAGGGTTTLAFGDVHGSHENLVDLLRAADVVDASCRWKAGKSHVVSLGDLIDRGPDSRAVLDLVMRLQAEARAVGGRFHVVLGNHELMNMLADFRYVSDEDFAAYVDLEPEGLREQAFGQFAATRAQPADGDLRAEFQERYPPGYFGRRAAFSPSGRYGKWLLTLPVLIVVGETAFVHGGLPPMIAELGGDAVNDTLRADMRGFIDAWHALMEDGVIAWDSDPLEAAAELAERLGADRDSAIDGEQEQTIREFVELSRSAVFDDRGPLWYRGTARCHPLLEAGVLDPALARLGVSRVVVGHSPAASRRLVSRLDGRVVVVDTGMYAAHFRGRNAALVMDSGGLSALYPDEPGRDALTVERPNALSTHCDVDVLERLLTEAPLSGERTADPTDRRYELLELAAETSALPVRFTSARQYGKEIAAWRLDRVLGLGMVPPAVRRDVKGKSGAMTLWGAGLRSEAERAEGDFERPNWCASGNDYQLMYVLDALIDNPRAVEAIRYTAAQKNLVLTDHLDAFGTQSRIPEYLRDADVVIPPELSERLESLGRAQLEALLGDVLSKRQIGAVLKRRDRILETWAMRIPDTSGR